MFNWLFGKSEILPAKTGEAETLILSDYLRSVRRHSSLIPGKIINDGYTLECPCCRTINPEPKHGRPGKCKSCGLKWTAFGNSLEISR